MKILTRCLVTLTIVGNANLVWGETLGEYIKVAQNYQNSGKLEQATGIMEEAVKEYPDSSDAYAYLGLYVGMRAGETDDFMEAGRLCTRSFEVLDEAVSLDSLNPLARFYRGLMGVNVPKFLGKLKGGIEDLEFLIEMRGRSPDKVSEERVISAYDLLGTGYQKNGEGEKAKHAWEKVIELAPGTKLAEDARENIRKLFSPEAGKSQMGKEKETEGTAATEPSLLVELGKAYFDAGDYEEAEKVLKKMVDIDSSNVKAYTWLALALASEASEGYDERIYENTNFRTELVFESMEFFDKAVALAPKDTELRFLRGMMGVNFPFFVGKLDQAIDDLNTVVRGNAPDSTKGEALYWLGVAYQKKAMSYWIDVVSRYSDTEASQNVFEGMRPAVKHIDLSEYSTPVLSIDFVLGFQDELAPQTAVWVEDRKSKFVKTIYVSGFSGYAKEKQVNLPQWANSSKFGDVDAVTGASIDLGEHIYVWDLRDNSGRRVKSGEYTVKVEVSYWPSMQYQIASAPIKFGEKEERTQVEKGNLIPYLEVKYLPEGGK
ncbi:hypothetical protein CH333_04660 [candidate division WOR-3 bacterium JGI_Cruoil_03_44_89]|uniref:DUF2271 domain-containing protein n=1 Tax=candidate division WOR-3 bacterium JGI_Cruoil_03_44_89 TaxID=1973748 RepID=A0A235BV61_UNCW3|nr:MAG: hypothetical protein CH333_04660 [candidate division WOR-3 bacterium JGI_Cruoil_03_44_89]